MSSRLRAPTASTALAVLVLVLVLVAPACTRAAPTDPSASPGTNGPGSPTAVGSPASGGELRYMLRYDPESIDPGFVLESEGAVVVDALFDSLLAYDDDLRPVPAVAERFEVDETTTLYTFHLDPDAVFHDGSPVDAQAFVRAWSRIVDGTADDLSPNAHHLAAVAGYEESRRDGTPLAGVEAVDAQTLRVTLQYPYADFPAVVAHPALGPVPAAAVEDTVNFREAPIGNGPFKMAGPWQHDEFIRVQRFEDHHRDVPKLDEVVFRIYRGDDAEEQAYADFEEGLVHVATVPRE
ncbi:MAG TPA: ABC transporter substrate-binding protein, partial [Nitriliruptorales bacterium]